METTKLRRFAQYARRTLMELVEARLQLVLQPGSAARRENAEAIKRLEETIKGRGEAQVIERVAYTWFNRFCALRFMDVNRYTRIGVVSPAEGQFQPEILAEAKMGHIDDETVPEKIRQKIFSLLEGRSPSHDPQGEAYRLLVVAACNAFYRAMPFLFERIDDYTELLMPDDLLSGNSILAYTREAMTPDACKDWDTGEPIVEVIGWLYQFYISEKKDGVFEGLKKGKKIEAESIPAATQLFTPHWIVRYLVENSLGRLWMLNRPSSRLVEKMDYYIKPEQPETGFLKISSPEEVKVCDPACGSGHMLTYAFDLLYAIYEEEGVDAADIPEKILTHNLYGIEIDERAGELAAFALTMKARAKQRRFFNKGIKPNICVLEKVSFDADELSEYMDFIGRDLFTEPLQTTLRQFEEADNFGSLIRPEVSDVDGMLRIMESKNVSGHLFLSQTHQKVLQALRQADYLSPRYHVVITNPPYLDLGNMNLKLKLFIESFYPDSKQGLDSAFIENCKRKTIEKGYFALITQRSWMFLSRLEDFRRRLLTEAALIDLCYLGTETFPEIAGEKVQNAAFVFQNFSCGEVVCHFSDINNVAGRLKESVFRSGAKHFFLPAKECLLLPGAPLAFWASDSLIRAFASKESINDCADIRVGLDTGDNSRFLRSWFEVSNQRTVFDASSQRDVSSRSARWVPHTKGGEYRKWFGNLMDVIAFGDGDYDALSKQGNKLPSRMFYFREGIFYTRVSSGVASFRLAPAGTVFNSASPTAFVNIERFNTVFCLLNSRVSEVMLRCLSPTLNFQAGEIRKLPVPDKVIEHHCSSIVLESIRIAKNDWNAYETSWGFTSSPLLNPDLNQQPLSATYQDVRAHWRELTLEMQRLEEENNSIFIDAYGLQEELPSEVSLNEITLTCNPYYRYSGDRSEDDLEAMLLTDTMHELVSYAVGCMFGRYCLDKPGLILANQGETLADYLRQVPEPRFPADDDNVIPMLDDDWFSDDIAERFRQFLRVAFGDAHYEENLQFVEKALGKKGKPQPIRDYFLKEFYSDHVKRYKKRPIYWLFCSGSNKGSFNALIYMHRYRPDTVSVVLKYLRDYRQKLIDEKDRHAAVSINPATSQGEKTKALKEVDRLAKMLDELKDYESDVLYPLATEQKKIDLDDGVKVNYLKLNEHGPALKKIPGLDAKEEE